MMPKVLVANRGESKCPFSNKRRDPYLPINLPFCVTYRHHQLCGTQVAIRILRSARELDWRTVALYTTEPNLDVSHATYADEVVELYDVRDYVSVDAIVEIATRCVILVVSLT